MNDRMQFGRLVRQRRKSLGLTQRDVAHLGGPSAPTQLRVEKAQGSPPSISTLRRYDLPLRWQPGTASRTWSGDQLPAAATDFAQQQDTSDLVRFPEEFRMSLEQLVALRQSSTRLSDAVRLGSRDDGALFDDVEQITEHLQSTILDITGSWISDLLEQNQGESAAAARNVVDLISAHQQDSKYTKIIA